MLKKPQKGVSLTTLKCGIEYNDESDFRQSEFSLLNVIGSLNVKRWNALKIAFACKTDENFVTKLLDIAQEYFNSKIIKEDNESYCGKKEINQIKTNKNKTDSVSNKTQHEVQENSFSKEKNLISISIIEGRNNNNLPGDNKITTQIKTDKKTKCTISLTQNIDSKIDIDKCKTNDFEEESTRNNKTLEKRKKRPTNHDIRKAPELDIKCEKSIEKENDEISNNLDIIKIRVCHYCSTCHIQDRCPINFPKNIINDGVDYKSWEEKYKLLYENQVNCEIQNNKKEIDFLKDNEKYSYSIISLPNLLCFKETNTNHGLGVFAKNNIEQFSQFGPLTGKMIKEVDIPEDFSMRDLWEICSENGNIYINTECADLSNWLKYIRPAPKREERNVTVISKAKDLYFVSIKLIKSGEELLYWQDSASTNKKKMEKTTCGGCNMIFSHPHYYRIHCSIFHDLRYSLTIRKYHCKICGAAVLGKENIMKHAAELHNGQGAYQCQFCKKFFLRLNYLEMHRTYGCSANPHRSRPLCDFCGRKFCQPQKLKVHIKRMHSDFSEVLKEFQCKNCLKILGSRAALQRHSKEVHQKQVEGACSCSRCGKRFQNKSNLKIHMLTHSGIKPFKCSANNCKAAFTTKQCLQFHYKKVHNFTEDSMPKIERSIDYTFQAYSGFHDDIKRKEENAGESVLLNHNSEESDSDNDSLDSHSIDDPAELESSPQVTDERTSTPNASPPPIDSYINNSSVNTNIKVVSKGSKKWIADESSHIEKSVDMYTNEKLNKDELSNISLQETEIYNRGKLNNMNDFSRHEASNASLLVEAALDSVCSEPNIEIDVSPSPNCTDSLVNNLYTLTQPENLPDVSYSDTDCIGESRDINLISPSVNDHVSVTDELNDELRHSQNIRIDYTNFHQEDFSPPNSPGIPRSNFVRNYINNLSPHNATYEQKNATPVPSPPRYDFGHAVNTDHLSSDESNGMAAQNLSLHNSKNDIQLDLSLYKASYKTDHQNYMRRMKFENENNQLGQEQINSVNENELSSNMQSSQSENKETVENQNRLKYPDDLSSNDIRNKFEIDLDLRLKSYENIDNETLRQRNNSYDNNDLDFRNKGYDLLDAVENRNKQYENIDSDFRADRNFEPLILNSSELQGLDMSARSFHNYPNINRYHHLYPEVDRVDLRLNYSPPPPAYTHADILRVVSLDLTPPGRHSVDLSLRSHPLHQIANTRLLTEHGLQTNPHRLLDQSRLLSTDLTSTRHLPTDTRLISETSSRILSEHTSRILSVSTDQLTASHLLNSDESRIISDQSRLLEQSRLIEGRILPPSNPSGTVSPVQGFTGYSVTQSPYHPTPIAPRPHVSSPTPTSYHHYSSYY